ncbi:MAG: helix-turn-helix transcriptional regulator [Variovorax sp.]|nr:helix-turn-helix transcriptional regulator [Variovorax sp.]
MLEAQPADILRWSTDSVPAGQRFDYFQQTLESAVIPMWASTEDRASFRNEVTMASLGPLAALRITGSPHASHRGSREIERSLERSFHLIINLTSPWMLEHAGRNRMLPGDAILTDSFFGHMLRTDSDYDIVHLKFPDAWLRQWVPSPAALVGRRIPVASGWGRALATYAMQLTPQFTVVSPLPSQVLTDHLGALLALAVHEATGTARQPDTAEKSLCDRIREVLRQRCTEFSLTATDVASVLGISVRTLHRNLAGFGESFGAMLMAARAEVALRMLESPIHRRLTVAEIGRRSGFPDPSHFSRVMTARFGRKPTQIRSASKAAPVQLPGHEEES